ncbi:hypothetical protein JQN58_03535 [Aneurinibacillus sp. BA2021]|nr:hypothetical protein [Aneurinibacillus sp. BA2021]
MELCTNSRGAVFFVVLIYVQLMLLVMLHAIVFLEQLRPISFNDRERMRLHYIAEAGIYFTLERMINEPDNVTPHTYQIQGVKVEVHTEPRGMNEIWIGVAIGRVPQYAARLWVVADRKTGAIIRWSETMIE